MFEKFPVRSRILSRPNGCVKSGFSKNPKMPKIKEFITSVKIWSSFVKVEHANLRYFVSSSQTDRRSLSFKKWYFTGDGKNENHVNWEYVSTRMKRVWSSRTMNGVARGRNVFVQYFRHHLKRLVILSEYCKAKELTHENYSFRYSLLAT